MTLRAVQPLDLPNLVAAEIGAAARPAFVEVDPRQLWVDEAYQRDLSDKSRRLIKKIVANWSWAQFKPPVVVRVDGVLHLIDGQHTAIAAVTHGGIVRLPVMLVEAAEIGDRARAFVGHNRDRVAVTPQQTFFAELAAGDETALTIAQVCDRACIKILKFPPSRGAFETGETVAVGAIRTLIDRRGPVRARKVLQALALCAPVGASWIKAAEALLYAEEYLGLFDPDALSLVVNGLCGEVPAQAVTLAAAKKLPLWRALVIVVADRRRRVRSAA